VNIVTLPAPPAANDPNFNTKVVAWMAQVKSVLEGASRVNDTPLGQQFQVGSFTTNTTITGTSTGTDVANFLSSFITAMTSKGLVSPTITRSGGA
jgi:hypothetical protein